MDERRIAGVAAYDASPEAPRPMRWSEIAPPAVPRQTLVTVEIAGGGETTAGGASLTYYAAPEDSDEAGRTDPALARWVGAPVAGVPVAPGEDSPYDPNAGGLAAVVQLAALDALGRATGLPAAAFLGGVRQARIRAYASLPSFAEPEAAVACAAAAVAAGFTAVKFHASGHREQDLETIAAARRELGSAVDLMWDASCAYDLYAAVAVGCGLADAGFLWFEAPLPDHATEALRALAAATRVPLVPDGLVQRSPSEWARDVRDGVWGALRLDVTRAPDLSSALRLLHVAEALGVPCELQSYGFPLGQHANLQLALTTRACRFFEAPYPVDDLLDGLAPPPLIEHGFVQVPEEPGLGHDVDVEALATRLEPLARAAGAEARAP